MRLRHRGKPKHVKALYGMLEEVNEDEMDKYVENAKRELLEWIDRETKNAIDEGVSLDECLATLLGIVLEQSYMPFAIAQSLDMTDEDVQKNFRIFSHQQGHKLVELFQYIIHKYADLYSEKVDAHV